ncbi:MAG TPA: efflux RND transporter periplasmic adaptor subunit [bacterium]|nr:efflux RND transporter periplasmic adaptor subunit [bacterium]HQL60672.1 efflux RND transporter periplasmic adaptor subunit [bacterium]
MSQTNKRYPVAHRWLLAFQVLALISCLLMFGCNRSQPGDPDGKGGGTGSSGSSGGPNKPEARTFRIPVTAQLLTRGPMNAYLQAFGTIRPLKEVELKAEMSGRIYFTKRWEDGDYVEANTLLAKIDDTTIQLDLREAERALEMAQQDLIPARATMERRIKEEEFSKKMFERGAYSEVQYEQARLTRIQSESQYQQALTTIETRRTQIEKLKEDLRKTDILAPFAGILLPAVPPTAGEAGAQETDLTLLEGTLVGSGQTVLRIADIRQVVVELDVPAKDIDFVKIGQTVELGIYSRDGRKYTGTVRDISSTLNPTTRTYTVKVIVDNPLTELRPGMFSSARIITETRPDAISVPRDLVMLRNNQYVVFVVEKKELTEEPSPKNATDNISSPTEETDTPTPAGDDSTNPDMPTSSGIAMADAVQDTGPAETAPADTIRDATDELEEPAEPVTIMVAKQRIVTLGIENRERVEIADGLKDGDLLVVLGYETLTDGVEVNAAIRGQDAGSEQQNEKPL